MHRRAIGLLAAAALLQTGYATPDCPGDLTGARCPDPDMDWRQVLRLAPIEDLAREGATVRRVYYEADGRGNLMTAITFIQRRGGTPRLEVTVLPIGGQAGIEGRTDPVTIEAAVPDEMWAYVIDFPAPLARDLTRKEPRIGEPIPGLWPPAAEAEGFCTHPDDPVVEGVGPLPDSPALGPWPRTVYGTCPDEAARGYVKMIAERALALLPQCRAIDGAEEPVHELFSKLMACAYLDGPHPLAAVAVLNQLKKRLPPPFADDAVMEWPGEPKASGRDAVAALWDARISPEAWTNDRDRASYAPIVIRGERPDVVVFKGIVIAQDEYALIEQMWRLVGGAFAVVRVRVGPFAKQAPAIP